VKPDTIVWLKLTNVGRPADAMICQLSTRDAILQIGKWILGAYMGQKIRITLARSEEELVENRKSSTVESMMSDLESLVGGTPEGSGSDNGDSEDA
jgi:hypothetical protein